MFKGNLSELNTFSDAKRNHVLKGLSALAKFLGVYEEFKGLIKSYGLTWKTANADDLIISRLTKTEENKNVIEWLKKVEKGIPKFSIFLKFVLVSGLRYVESIRAYNLIVDLASEGRLGSYYNVETEALEHFRFKKLFIRRTKKAFISFVPKQLVERIAMQEKITRPKIDNQIKRSGFKSRFGDAREYFATYMTKWLNPAEIDFLQGRVSASVFMKHYFNPALIGDLKQRVFKGIASLKALQ